MMAQVPADNIAACIEIGATMVVDNSFRITRGPRGIVQCDCIPLTIRCRPGVIRFTFSQKFFVSQFAQSVAAGSLRIIDINYE